MLVNNVDYACSSALRFLRFGCTSHATPIEIKYNPIIGVANTHMFMMSVVGVRIAAMMNIMRME